MKSHIGSLGNETSDVLAKRAAEEVPLDDDEEWMSGGGFQAVDTTEEERERGGR